MGKHIVLQCRSLVDSNGKSVIMHGCVFRSAGMRRFVYMCIYKCGRKAVNNCMCMFMSCWVDKSMFHLSFFRSISVWL